MRIAVFGQTSFSGLPGLRDRPRVTLEGVPRTAIKRTTATSSLTAPSGGHRMFQSLRQIGFRRPSAAPASAGGAARAGVPESRGCLRGGGVGGCGSCLDRARSSRHASCPRRLSMPHAFAQKPGVGAGARSRRRRRNRRAGERGRPWAEGRARIRVRLCPGTARLIGDCRACGGHGLHALRRRHEGCSAGGAGRSGRLLSRRDALG